MTQPTDLAVVSCHFNPCHYQSRDQNVLRTMTALADQAIPLYLANLVFTNQDAVVPTPTATVLTLQGRDVLWHKERLLNLLIGKLPSRYTKVAWIDADILFPDSRWFPWASELLDTYDLIQLYDRVEQRDNDGQPIAELAGLAAYVASDKPHPFNFDRSCTWPGLAWAAKRQVLTTHGLFDAMIVGGADTYMSIAAFGQAGTEWHLNQLAPKLKEAWSTWATRFFQDIQGRVGFVPTPVVQLGHGTRVNRRYVDRMHILTTYDFDPTCDITPDEHGVWQWATHKPLLHRAVHDYFEARREDTFGKDALRSPP